MTSSSSLIVFDGNNTLWNVETLRRGSSVPLPIAARLDVTPDEVDRFQRARDAELHTSMG